MTKIAYHVTPRENIPHILANGIIPQLGERSVSAGESIARTYLFGAKTDVENALMNWLGDEFDEDVDLAVLVVNVSDIKTYSDADYELITDHIISTENIVAVLKEENNFPIDYEYCNINSITVRELNLNRNNVEFFSFAVDTPNDIINTNWMTVVDGVIHDAYWVECDTYDEGSDIPTSPVVSIPAPTSTVDDHLAPVLLTLFLDSISKKTGLNIDVPMLCEGDQKEQINKLKGEVGYVWDAEIEDYKPSRSALTMK